MEVQDVTRQVEERERGFKGSGGKGRDFPSPDGGRRWPEGPDEGLSRERPHPTLSRKRERGRPYASGRGDDLRKRERDDLGKR